MQVLTATRETQGQRADDFSWTVEGELVRLPASQCHRPDACGCGRALAGLASSKATTTVKVVERPELDFESYRTALHDALVRERWITAGDAGAQVWVTAWAREQADMAAYFEPGTVLELRDDELRARTPSCPLC